MNRIAQQNVEVLVNGKPVKVHAHDGRLFVEGKEGSEYTIKLKNDGYSRVLAVVSVDGINVVSGELATDDGAGYIVNGRGSYEIKGFRVSDEGVNPFAFGKKKESYAAKSEATEGDTSNCAVIGVKFFSEKYQAKIRKHVMMPYRQPYRRPWNDDDVTPWIPRPVPQWPTRPDPSPIWMQTKGICGNDGPSGPVGEPTYSSSLFNCSLDMDNEPIRSVSRARALDFDLGTVFTDKTVTDKVTTVSFDRGELLEFVEIFYASRDVLESLGVVFEKQPTVSFPSSFKSTGYCKRPQK